MTTVLHDRLVQYLTATGWIPPEEVGQVGGLWRHPRSDYLLPVPNELDAEGIDWQVITERLAMVEGATVSDVVDRLTGRMVDIANLRAANDIIIRDTIPYAAGVTLVQSSWTMLRASATTALGAKANIRSYRKTGDGLISTARMAHTRRGSFVIPILLPIPDPKPGAKKSKEPPIPGMDETTYEAEPMERRVMRTFAEALAAIDVVAVQPEREPRASVDYELVRAGVSHQLLGALHRVLTETAVSEFSAKFEWAPLGPPPKGLREISIPTAASDRIKVVANRLKTSTAPRLVEAFSGPIRGVARDLDTDSGLVTVQTTRNGHPANVSVRVSAEVLDEAWQWARDRQTVVVKSTVRRTSEGLMADRSDAVEPMMSILEIESSEDD
ncbi:hypothetical protein [Mycolicibacter heraklionensis]|uniref:hypothetical protein n=1 Tax=Mycolicibacter heraklionensis TaxID=512402 RepID=UPI000AAF1179|nr:hypothetical protein [Mycolicibacter heraklionensis]